MAEPLTFWGGDAGTGGKKANNFAIITQQSLPCINSLVSKVVNLVAILRGPKPPIVAAAT